MNSSGLDNTLLEPIGALWQGLTPSNMLISVVVSPEEENQ